MTSNLTQRKTHDDNNEASSFSNGATKDQVFETEFERNLFMNEVRRITYLIISQFPTDFRYKKDLVLDFGNDNDMNNEDALFSFLEVQLRIYKDESPHQVAKRIVGVIREYFEER